MCIDENRGAKKEIFRGGRGAQGQRLFRLNVSQKLFSKFAYTNEKNIYSILKNVLANQKEDFLSCSHI